MLRQTLATLLLVSVARTLPAQSAQEVCDAMADVAVGYWAEYQISGAGLQGPMQGGSTSIRQAIVNSEAVNGTQHWWMETRMETPMGEAIVQMLVPAWPFSTGDIQAMVMKMGDQPALRVSDQMMQMMRSQLPDNPSMEAAMRCGEGEVVGWEEVTVPAGTFRALHVRPAPEDDMQSEVWVSPDVPFGMVKVIMTGADGGEIVLAGHGTDATSSITETPRDMPGMGR